MKLLFLYDYQFQNPLFPYTGLQISPYLFARELRKLGHTVVEKNLFFDKNYGDADTIIPCGFWGDLEFLGPTTIPVVPYMTTDGQIPKKFVDKINSYTHFITQSESCKRVATRDGVDPNKLSIVYPSPDMNIFKPIPNPENRMLKIIFTNFLHGGDKELIQATPMIASKYGSFVIILKIHHKVTKEHFSWAKPLIKELGVGNYVRWMDKQFHNLSMPPFYQHCDLYVSLGGIIGFELPFQEANACGCPVVGLDYGAVPEFITNGYNGYMVPLAGLEKYKATKAGIELSEELAICNPKDAAEKIVDILTHDDLRIKMGENGRKLVETKFNSKTQGKILSDILEKVI